MMKVKSDIKKQLIAEKQLRMDERFLTTILQSIQDGISVLDNGLTIMYVNPTMEKWYKHAMPIIGKKCYEVYHDRNQPCEVCPSQRTIKTGNADYNVVIETDKEGQPVRYVGLYTFPLVDTDTGQRRGVIEYVRDITEQKNAEAVLIEREKELQIEARNLEEVNTALRVLLKRMDEDKIELEEKVLLNVKEMILPYLEKLKLSGLDERQETYASILESSLSQIISSFSLRMSSKSFNFTPKELQVANLLKQGKTNKEIGELLNSSPRTVAYHRESIRRKLGLKNKKANLKSYLLSFK